MKLRNIFLSLVLGVFMLILASCGKSTSNSDIIATNFVGYDFTKEIAKDKLSYRMLLQPGADIHGYEPTPSDLKEILNCKVFIYVGGESDEWVESSILNQIDKTKTTVINMFDVLENKGNIYHEEEAASMEEEHEHAEGEEHNHEEEYDEHVWNDLCNAILISEAIKDVLSTIDSANKDTYQANFDSYKAKLTEIDNKFVALTKDFSKIFIVADRFPLLYFVNRYKLNYDAALSGCSESNDAGSTTIKNLVNVIQTNNVKYIYTIELSEGKIANKIIEEINKNINNGSYTGTAPTVLTFYSMHNISTDDFNKGVSYLDMMNLNYDSLAKLINE